ncbi:sterol desaturase family protein [Panacibacter ginsenosidivorans]|uniref:Sterol desaturase family protein n=1 Tax=Panacibacter ginsenosidivorans TaxID=1813871 RepID=A0A5B8V6J5_9BACT|nr:sterol desaturase family protein [Panacibacter ginsenosidivorans]QEC66902.1 sterol desaturase family protein [Panacibacter ginsenosidivorans]
MNQDTILLHAIPGFILLVILEFMFFVKENRDQYKKDFPVSLGIGAGFIISAAAGKGVTMYLYSVVYSYRIFDFANNVWWVWIICFFADDLTYYWFHRLSHKIRFFWASHAVHHSSETFSFLANLRESWTSNITGILLFWIWLPFVGFEPGLILLIKSVSIIYQFCIHTEVINKLPKWVEAIFNTPSHHRVHHGCNIDYLDKNYGGIFIIWDRLFGTFVDESKKPVYGLTKKINSRNPVKIAFHEWYNMFNDLRKAISVSEAFNFIFNAPGWSKDGSSKTTNQLRKKETTASEKGYKKARNNHAVTRQPLISILKILLITLLIGCNFSGTSQQLKLHYAIMQGSNKIGWMNIEKTDSSNLSSIRSESETKKRMITLFTFNEKQESVFENGLLIKSYVYRKINNEIKFDQQTAYTGNQYIIRKTKNDEHIPISGIYYNQLSLYFSEPVNIKQVYSDFFHVMLTIEKNKDGMYKLTLPDGNINYYLYTNGICTYVKIVRSLFTIEFKLS